MTEEKFNEYVNAFTDALFRFVLKNVKDVPSAEDIVQESFVRLWETRDKVREGSQKSYLFTIAYRLVIDRARRLRHSSGVEVETIGRPGPSEGYSDLGQTLSRALDGIKEEWRSLIMLRDWEGYSYEEIAAITGASISGVKVGIFRARTELRRRLGPIDDII
ncbi:MAG: RNA polymerase sigma factor [Rikenellaceae bacterium]|nr:RNA polymerase sigma factor [Rikenellaceae bacterium]